MKNVAIILSGGKGKRLGADIPKQYIEIGKRPLLAFSLIAFEKSLVDEIVIVAASEYIDYCRKIAEDAGISKLAAVVSGGNERYDSVWEGLKFLKDRYSLNKNQEDEFNRCNELKGCNEDNARKFTVDNYNDLKAETGCYQDYNRFVKECSVLIHDGARPFIRTSVINEVLKEVERSGAAIAAAPCTDTIKIADEEGFISSTTERRLTWSAQTPQGFRFDDIYEAYRNLLERPQFSKCSLTGVDSNKKSDIGDYNVNANEDCCTKVTPDTIGSNTEKDLCIKEKAIQITDDAMVYQMKYPERRVKLVMAGQENIKITTSKDIILAESLLQN